MAREKRGRRRRRDSEPEVVEEVVEEQTRGGRRERAPRVPGGPGFALTAGLVAGFGAGLLAFITTLWMAQTTGVDPAAAFDAGGVQAARMLAANDLQRWDRDFGTNAGLHRLLKQKVDDKLAQLSSSDSSYVDGKYDNHVEVFRKGLAVVSAGELDPWPEWLAFDKLFPKADTADELIMKARTETLSLAQAGEKGAFHGAAVTTGAGAIAKIGEVLKGSEPTKQVGDTKIYAIAHQGNVYRSYEHPMRDRSGNRAAGATAVVTLNASSVAAPDHTATAAAAGGTAFVGAFLLGFIVCLKPVKSMRRLAQQAASVAAGELDTRILVAGTPLVQSTAKSLQQIVAMVGENTGPAEVVTQTVVVPPSEEIVHALAPTSAIPQSREFEIESTHKHCEAVGNDYHDVIEVDDDRIGFFVADIPLRGVEGAMLMAQIKALFRASAPGETSPAEVLRKINRTFARDLPRGVYATAAYAICSKSSGICTFANAQHLPVVFWKLARKSSARVSSEGIALGLDAGAVFDKTIEEKSIQLDKGDRIVLFTDGAIAARNAAGAQYGEKRFYYVVNKEAPKNSAAFVNFVANDVDLFHEGAPQLDDFTILTVRRVS